jgi:outer membrane usher protein
MAIVILSVIVAPRQASAADQTLLLEVVINGYATGKIGEFMLRDGALFARRTELADVGLRVPDVAPVNQEGLIPLSALPGVTSRLDQATQTLIITAGIDRLLPAVLPAGATIGTSRQIESGTGATLNYDIVGTSIGRQNSANGLFDLRAFSPWGVISSGALAYAGASPSGPGGYSAIRLDSTYVYSDPNSMRRYRLGDFITSGLSWTRPVRLGGAQINSDFSMRPDLVTFPLPSVGGSVAVPSTVDVLVNGTQIMSRQVQPGPFQIPQLPVITGAGTVVVSVSDALGRQVSTALPFYASSNLLAPGLQVYSTEVGAVRLNWGLLSNDYDHPAASATYRRGLSSDVTIEAHAEVTSGQLMAGGGVVANVFDLGVVNLAVAASTGSGRTGKQLSIGAERIGPSFSLGASVIIADHNFRDIAAMNGDPVPRQQVNANAGVSLGRFGSLGIAYAGVDRDSAPAPISFFAPPGTFLTPSSSLPGGVLSVTGNIVSFVPAEHAHIVSASYSVQVRNLAFYATGFHDFVNGGSSGVLFGVTIPLGSRSSVSASVGSASAGGFAQVQAVQSPVSIGDWGYQAFGGVGQPNHEFAELQYKSPWALVSAGADRLNSQTTLRTEGQGALSHVDGGLFPSNTINDSFGVVNTNGAKGIHVYDENREVGQTDSAGQLLLPDLRSFDVNRIAIEPTDIPADSTVSDTTRDVRPQDRSGVVIRFGVQASHGALLRLVYAAGTPIGLGSSATLAATGVTVPVGYDGEAYVQDLSPRGNRLAVQRMDGRRCIAIFNYRGHPGAIPTIGPLRCQDQ